jgi:hypothetical protein
MNLHLLTMVELIYRYSRIVLNPELPQLVDNVQQRMTKYPFIQPAKVAVLLEKVRTWLNCILHIRILRVSLCFVAHTNASWIAIRKSTTS